MRAINHPYRGQEPICEKTRTRLLSITQTLSYAIPILTPYYSRMLFIDSTGLGPLTAAIDSHGRFFYDAERLGEMTNEQLAFVIQHEVLHVLLDHPKRVSRLYQLLDSYLLEQIGLGTFKDDSRLLHILQHITAMSIDIEVDHSIPPFVMTQMGKMNLATIESHEMALRPLRAVPGIDPTRSMEYNVMLALREFASKVQQNGFENTVQEYALDYGIYIPSEDEMEEMSRAAEEILKKAIERTASSASRKHGQQQGNGKQDVKGNMSFPSQNEIEKISRAVQDAVEKILKEITDRFPENAPGELEKTKDNQPDGGQNGQQQQFSPQNTSQGDEPNIDQQDDHGLSEDETRKVYEVVEEILRRTIERLTASTSENPEQQPIGQSSQQSSGQLPSQPTPQQGGQSSTQSAGQPHGQSSPQPTGQQGEQSSTQPAGQQGQQSSTQSAGQPHRQSSTQPTGQQGQQSSTQSAGQPHGQSSPQPTGQQGQQSSTQSAGQPHGQSSSQPTGQQGQQSSTHQIGHHCSQDGGQHSSHSGSQNQRAYILSEEEIEKISREVEKILRQALEGSSPSASQNTGQSVQPDGQQSATQHPGQQAGQSASQQTAQPGTQHTQHGQQQGQSGIQHPGQQGANQTSSSQSQTQKISQNIGKIIAETLKEVLGGLNSGDSQNSASQNGQSAGQSSSGANSSRQMSNSKPWSGGMDCGSDAFGHHKIKHPYRKIFTDGPIVENDGRVNPVPDIKSIKQEIARDIRNYEARKSAPNNGGSGRGTIPEGLIRHIVEVENPTIDYLQEFEEHMQNIAAIGRVEEDFSRPHPIFAAYEQLAIQGYFSEPPIPETYIHYSCSLGIIVDTSGSVSDAEVAYARESVAEILNRQQFSRMYLCAVDADVHFCEEISSITPDMLRGNGGTNLIRAFDVLAERDVDALLIFTDQGTPWPSTPVGVPVVVVSHRPKQSDIPKEYKFFQLENPQLKTMLDALRNFTVRPEVTSGYFAENTTNATPSVSFSSPPPFRSRNFSHGR